MLPSLVPAAVGDALEWGVGCVEKGVWLALRLAGLAGVAAWLPKAAWPWPACLAAHALGSELTVCQLQTEPRLARLSRLQLFAIADWLRMAAEDDPLLIVQWDSAREAALTAAWGTSARAAIVDSLKAAGATAHPDAPDTIFAFASAAAMMKVHEDVMFGHAGHPSRYGAFQVIGPLAACQGGATQQGIARSIVIFRASLGQTVVDSQFFDVVFSRH